MWKYVSRRLKDSLERTCNVLDAGRTTFCSSSSTSELPDNHANRSVSEDGGGGQEPQQHQVAVFRKRRGCVKWFRDRNGFSSQRNENPDEEKAGQERRRERLNHHDEMPHPWINALTWSSAIVCGWYTSQYLCMRRKRLGWTPIDQHHRAVGSCAYGNILLTTTRSLHSNITSRIALAAPPSIISSGIGSQSTSSSSSSLGDLLQNVNNPLQSGATTKTRGRTPSTTSTGTSRSDRSTSSLDSAVAEFSSTIGEIEYQFGVQDVTSDDFESAVHHFKLATTHHHTAATFNLGLCYERGLGVQRDLKMAMQCYSVASAQGHPKAMYNLGVFYVRGWGGLKRSRKAARECFDSAARLGQKEAQLAMGMERERQLRRQEDEFKPKLMTMVNEAPFGVHAF